MCPRKAHICSHFTDEASEAQRVMPALWQGPSCSAPGPRTCASVLAESLTAPLLPGRWDGPVEAHGAQPHGWGSEGEPPGSHSCLSGLWPPGSMAPLISSPWRPTLPSAPCSSEVRNLGKPGASPRGGVRGLLQVSPQAPHLACCPQGPRGGAAPPPPPCTAAVTRWLVT